MPKRFVSGLVLCIVPLFLMAQNAEDIVFHKQGYNIEKVLEMNKVIQPFGMCFDEEGNLLTTNWYSLIYQISPDGSVSKLRYGGYGKQWFFPGLADIRINPINGDIVVGGQGGIYKFDKSTADLEEISADACYHLAFDKYGNLYFSDNPGRYIQKYNLNSGDYTHAWTENLGFRAEGIVFDSLENLYICDCRGGRLVKLEPPYHGVSHDTIIDDLGLVYDVSIDGENNLYVLAEDTESPPDNWYIHRSEVIKINAGSYSSEMIKNDLPQSLYLRFKNNEIFLSSRDYDAIKKIDADGNLIDYTKDHKVRSLYTISSDLGGNPILCDYRLGKLFRFAPPNQPELLAEDMGYIQAVETNDSGELYCSSRRRENVSNNYLWRIPFDGSPPEFVADFDANRTYDMKFLHRDNNRLTIRMIYSYEVWLFDLITEEITVLANNLTNRIGFDLDDENYLYVAEGRNEALKRAPYPVIPPVDMSAIPNLIIMNLADPDTIRFFEVAPDNDVYIPVDSPEGELYIGPSDGGYAELLASGFAFPNATHFDRYGRLWVPDSGNGLFKITNRELIVTQNIKNCDYLTEEAQESGIHVGTAKVLIKILEGAKSSLENNNVHAAIGQIIGFWTYVKAQKGKKIPEDIAERWLIIGSSMIKALQEVS